MKFSIFLQMERPDDNISYQQCYDNFYELCQIANEAKLHSIWTGEHHCMNFTIAPNPFITIASLAKELQHVRLGTGTIVAPFWHPIKLAEEAAMTDIVCNGRLDIGIARGAYSFEYERLLPGLEAMEAGLRMREMIPAIKKLWQGDYQHQGQYHNFTKATSIPKPIQKNGPPIWVAARDPSSHDFAIKQECHVQVTPLWLGIEEITSLKQRFDEACEKNKPTHEPKILLLHHTFIGQDEADVNQAAKELSRYFCYFGTWFKNDRPVNNGFIQTLSQDDMDALPHFSPPAMKNNLTIGTTQEVIDKIKIYHELGFTEYAYWVDSGMKHERKVNSLLRFINDVIPKIV